MQERTRRNERYRQLGLHTDARIGWTLGRSAHRWPQREFIVFEGNRLSYRQVLGWVTAIGHDLVAAGVEPGDRVLWQLPNSLEAIVLHLAAWRIGAVSVPVVPLYRAHEMASILAEVQPSVVAFAAGQGDREPVAEMEGLMGSTGIAPKLRIVVGGDRKDWTQLRPMPFDDEVVDDGKLPSPADADDCCLILFTSGTTAAPKGVMHSSNSLLAEAAIYRDTYGLGFEDTVVMGAPITHIGGLFFAVVMPMTFGARSCLLPAWNADAAVEAVARERATISSGAAVFLQGFVDRYEQAPADAYRLPVFVCGGAAVPPSLIERAETVGILSFRCWGMSECPGATLGSTTDALELRANRDGKLVEETEVEAVDDSHRALPPGEAGELRLRSPAQMLGYTDPAATAAQVDDDGWFYTGDVGFVDPAGWVTITGRIKDIINRGGEKFSALDIENAIVAHPAISSAAVVGVPDERLGEKVAAFVTLAPGASWPGRQVLLDHLEGKRMARQKFPVAWRVLDELPMTMSGKLKKNDLLDRWVSDLSAAPDPT